jgi:hypothetical protein
MNHDSILGTGLTYHCEIEHPDGTIERFTETNLIPQAAVDFIAGLIVGSGPTPVSSWFIGIYEGNYVPTSGVTSASLPSPIQETTAYSEVLRPEWDNSYDGIGVLDNSDNKAEFTMTAAKTLYGAFVVSASDKGGNSGLILSIARFSTPREVVVGSIFRVTAGLTLVPTNVV